MKLIGDLKENIWIIDKKINPENIPYSIGFRLPGTKTLKFNNLSFSISFFENDTEVFSKQYPEDNQKFISSNQLYLVSDIVENIKPLTEYRVDISATNSDITFDDSFFVTTPEPYKPYPSWEYDEELGDYVPPVDYPDDDKLYNWNETQQKWIVLE